MLNTARAALKNSAVNSASAARAATAAAMADGKVLLVAKEMDDTSFVAKEEGSFGLRREPSFSNPGNIRKKALKALTSGEHVGSFSCHGIEPKDEADGGVAKVNQDAACIAHPVNGDNSAALFCVFDGHGAEGDPCAQFAAKKLVHCPEREVTTLKKKQKLSSRVAELYDPNEPKPQLSELFERSFRNANLLMHSASSDAGRRTGDFVSPFSRGSSV